MGRMYEMICQELTLYLWCGNKATFPPIPEDYVHPGLHVRQAAAGKLRVLQAGPARAHDVVLRLEYKHVMIKVSSFRVQNIYIRKEAFY